MSIRLRELIRAVRACKTAQEERAVIAKECALIRTAFKENNVQYRHRNVAKTIFIQMLGYPSHFGQLECLKLIASPNFPEKRIGYLALMLLLDERTEVLMLVTNSIKNDLEHDSQFVVGLALTAVGNLATADMARTLAQDVARHLESSNPYVRKKAALATIRLLKRVPELAEDYVDKIVALLKDRSHGVLISAVQLMIDVLNLEDDQDASIKQKFSRVVPTLVKMLRNLLNLGYSPEHDIAGIADPFLQVKLLRLLQTLGHKNDEASEAMNDVLAQVATNTETNRNAGNAILYECVRAIMTVESESGLRVLAINILGRFLINRDNNIRYVALNSLAKVVSDDPAAVQRHRSTILDCLKDPDVSIRQRALELTYQLVNQNNVQELVREMLNYLVVATGHDHRAHLCSRIANVVDKYAPSPKWQIDVVVTMLSIAGNNCDDSLSSTAVAYICVAEDPALQGYATHKLFHLLRDELPQVQLALVHVAVWCIGEFGDALLNDCEVPESDDDPIFGGNLTIAPEPENEKKNGDEISGAVLTSMKRTHYEAIPVAEILGLLEAVLKSHLATVQTKSYVLTSLAKLATRFTEGKEETADLVASFATSMNLELQQRSCEYAALLEDKWGSVRPEALARMPAMDMAAAKASTGGPTDFSDLDALPDQAIDTIPGDEPVAAAVAPPAAAGGPTSLLDLDDIFAGGSQDPPPPAQQPPPAAPATDVDLLSDIFAGGQAPPQPPPADPFGGMPAEPAPQPPSMMVQAAAAPPIDAFEKDGLKITMECTKDGAGIDVLCTFTNATPKPMERLIFQAAVPKYVTMEMKPASASTLPPNSNSVTQLVKVHNTQPAKALMMRLKIRYQVGGRQIEEQVRLLSFSFSDFLLYRPRSHPSHPSNSYHLMCRGHRSIHLSFETKKTTTAITELRTPDNVPPPTNDTTPSTLDGGAPTFTYLDSVVSSTTPHTFVSRKISRKQTPSPAILCEMSSSVLDNYL